MRTKNSLMERGDIRVSGLRKQNVLFNGICSDTNHEVADCGAETRRLHARMHGLNGRASSVTKREVIDTLVQSPSV